ncbi:uncharacterized protein LOC107646550 [Arachis ipaensis]|uniref:DUF4283 domain-containing protein n=1 Tax=Arachis hypogaea TaxID=3818 RepID=A0A444YJ68_ARAHY|nr:uncharacterized protein LOC107646550 [Arachis ipaensis]RYR01995.1 hypothetical protein Ahy_B06g080852 [Arachis hypogaea]
MEEESTKDMAVSAEMDMRPKQVEGPSEGRKEAAPKSFAQAVKKGTNRGEPRTENSDRVATDHLGSSDDENEELGIKIEKTPNGLYNLVISESIKYDLRKHWWESLIVKVLGRKVSLAVIKRRLEAMWSRMGSLDVIDIGNDYFLVRFYNAEDLDYALMEGPWKILDHYLTIQLWKLDFNPSKATIDNIAAWIRLPCLAIEYYNRIVLEKIGNILGRTIKVDTNTSQISRGKFSRICVEIDLTKPLVS